MRFRIAHFFLLFVVVAVALATRSVASNTRNVGLIWIAAISISACTAIAATWLGSNFRNSILCGLAASSFVLALHITECSFQSPATDYASRYVSYDMYFVVVPVVLLISAVTSSALTFLVRVLSAWIVRSLTQ